MGPCVLAISNAYSFSLTGLDTGVAKNRAAAAEKLCGWRAFRWQGHDGGWSEIVRSRLTALERALWATRATAVIADMMAVAMAMAMGMGMGVAQH